MNTKENEAILPSLKIGIALLSFICLTIFVYVLHQAADVLIPFAVAVFVYMLLQPVIKLLEKGRVPRVLVTVAVMGFTIIILMGISQLIYQSASVFTSDLPRYEERFNDLWARIGEMIGRAPRVHPEGWNITKDPWVAEWLKGATIPNLVNLLLASVNSLLSNFFLVFIFLLLLLLGRDLLPRKLKHAFSPSLSGRLTEITQGIRANIQKYLVIKTLVSLLASGIVMLITWSFGLDFVIIWGILTFFLNFIPNIGSIVSSGLPMLFALVQFDNPMTAVWMGLLIFAEDFTIGNFLEPRLTGKRIDLSPLLIMFSLIFWGSIWGIVGMFLSVPLTAIVKIVCDNIEPLRPIGILMGEDVPAPRA
jgi:AI-2 transport protein TqsA